MHVRGTVKFALQDVGDDNTSLISSEGCPRNVPHTLGCRCWIADELAIGDSRKYSRDPLYHTPARARRRPGTIREGRLGTANSVVTPDRLLSHEQPELTRLHA